MSSVSLVSHLLRFACTTPMAEDSGGTRPAEKVAVLVLSKEAPKESGVIRAELI